MGFWDFFKKKSVATPNTTPTPAKRTMVDVLETYRTYLTCYLQLQHESNPLPIGAYQNAQGELVGYIQADSPEGYALPLSQYVANITEELGKRLQNGEIKSFICLYHSDFTRSSRHDALDDENDCSAISIHYEEAAGLSGTTALPYEFTNDRWAYAAIFGLTSQQTQELINNKLENKNYFPEIIYIQPPTYTSASGVPITAANQFGTGNLLNGIFGYNRFQANGLGLLESELQKMQVLPPIWADNDNAIYQLHIAPLSIQVVLKQNQILGAMPIVDTEVVIDTETKSIAEWENFDNLLAVISASGRQTFGIKYIAMDYGINKQRYQNERKLNVKMNGIILVADKSSQMADKEDGSLNLSPNFVGYLPHQQLAPQGGIEFTGLVEYFEEANIFEGVEGYIIRMQLINQPDNPNMFTIDMYAARDNMRFKTPLERGMSISGVAMIQGQLAD